MKILVFGRIFVDPNRLRSPGMRWGAGLLAVTFLVSALASAQAQPPQKPVPPPRPSSSWKIVYYYGLDPKVEEPEKERPPDSKNETVKEVLYEVTGDTARVTRKLSSGTEQIAYVKNGFVLYENPASKKIRVRSDVPSTSGAGTSSDALATRIFPGFDWVEQKHFVGAAERFKQPCLYYRLVETLPSTDPSEPSAASTTVREAWISAATRLPVGFRNGSLTGIYQLLPDPKQPVQAPEEYLRALKEAEAPPQLPPKSYRR